MRPKRDPLLPALGHQRPRGRHRSGHFCRCAQKHAEGGLVDMSGKVVTMARAVGECVRDGDTVVIEGFTHLICFAAGHEIIRQKKRDLVACRLTPDLIYDQMVARFMARPSHLLFMDLKTFEGSDLPKKNKNIKFVRCPYTGKRFATAPALNPDVAIIQVQRADEEGNGQIWGLMGVQREAAFAATKVVVVAEGLVSGDVIRADPNRTLIPGLIVAAVVIEPFAAHPSYALGYYDRDNDFYVQWAKVSKDKAGLDTYLAEGVYGGPGRKEYREKFGAEYLKKLEADNRPPGSGNYGF